jgi:hypothetical protein
MKLLVNLTEADPIGGQGSDRLPAIMVVMGFGGAGDRIGDNRGGFGRRIGEKMPRWRCRASPKAALWRRRWLLRSSRTRAKRPCKSKWNSSRDGTELTANDKKRG